MYVGCAVLLRRSEWRAAVEASGAAAAAQFEALQQQLAALATEQQAQGKELLEQVGMASMCVVGVIVPPLKSTMAASGMF